MRLLRRHNQEPGAILGSGIEGTVVDLSSGRVAKIWHGRTRADIEALARFGSALDVGGLPFSTPLILELLEENDLVISIERKVDGQPLASRPDPHPMRVDAQATRLLGDVLHNLTRVVVSPALSALPLLPGGQPFDRRRSFTASLAALVERRFSAAPRLLHGHVDHLETLVSALAARLRSLPPPSHPAVLHGDLIPANVLVQSGQVTGVLDFGFMTTVGDPHFDAAITASIFDMYGPNARQSETVLTREFISRFGHDPDRYGLYRAAYAVITHAYFMSDSPDGHFLWCAEMLRRPSTTAALI